MLKKFIPADILFFLAAIWIVFIVDFLLVGISLNQFGIYPRSIHGLWGILFSPFLHGGLYHIISNSIPILILGSLLGASVGPKKLRRIMILGALGSGLGVWLFSSGGPVVGASGMLFSLLAYLFADALFNPSLRSWIFAIIAFLAYGGTLLSLVNFIPHISWSAHFWGFITGILLAFYGRKGNRS